MICKNLQNKVIIKFSIKDGAFHSFIARSFFGSVIGNVVTFPLCGILVDAYGWPTAFYVIGGI